MDEPRPRSTGAMPPEPRDDRRTVVTSGERELLVGPQPRDDLLTSKGRQRILRRRNPRLQTGGGWRRWIWAVVLVFAAGLFLLALWFLRTRVPESFPPPALMSGAEARAPLAAAALTFASPDGRRLVTETRFVTADPPGTDPTRTLVETLIAGPTGQLFNPWPPEAVLLGWYLTEDGIAYVNLGGSLRVLLASGDQVEWLLVASLTCTVCESHPTVRGVRLLVDGESQGFLRRVMPLEWTYCPDMFAEAR
jgi:hypothetical protein